MRISDWSSDVCSSVLIGDQLGLYKALARQPMNASELAAATGTSERYMREWLGNQAAGGYVDYDADADRYALSPEQVLCMADPDGPVDVPRAYSIVEAALHATERPAKNFRSGGRSAQRRDGNECCNTGGSRGSPDH